MAVGCHTRDSHGDCIGFPWIQLDARGGQKGSVEIQKRMDRNQHNNNAFLCDVSIISSFFVKFLLGDFVSCFFVEVRSSSYLVQYQLSVYYSITYPTFKVMT